MVKQLKPQELKLVKELQNGSVSAFETIFRLYWKPLYLLAKSKLDSHDEAEEVIQSVFTALWENREKVIIENISAYLYTSVKNRIINVIRGKINREKYLAYYRQFLPETQDTTENAVDFNAMNEDLRQAVNNLPEKSRNVFRLSRLEGRSNAEIASMLKVSEKAIEYHLTKSLKEIRIQLKDYIAVFLVFCIF